MLTLNLIMWTMLESVMKVVNEPETLFWTMFLVFFGETLAALLGVAITCFFIFHTWLVGKAMTTIEFCEKTLPNGKKKPQSRTNAGGSSTYDIDLRCNFEQVLGSNPLLWMFPWGPPIGDGTSFISTGTRRDSDTESGTGVRHRGHKRTRRRVSAQQLATVDENRGPSGQHGQPSQPHACAADGTAASTSLEYVADVDTDSDTES